MNKQYDTTIREMAMQRDALLLKMALLHIQAEADQEAEEKYNADPSFAAAYEAYQNRTAPKIMKLINAIAPRQNAKKDHRFALKALNTAAAVLVIVFLLSASALAFIPAVRQSALKLLIQVEQNYTELRLAEDPDAHFDVPTQWQGEYFPTYIPEGFAIHSIDESKLAPDIAYRNQNGEKLVFTEYGDGSGVVLDTEDAVIETVLIKGETGQCAVKGNSVRVYWQHDNKFFILLYEGEKSEAISIAQSVVEIR